MVTEKTKQNKSCFRENFLIIPKSLYFFPIEITIAMSAIAPTPTPHPQYRVALSRSMNNQHIRSSRMG